MNSSCDGVSSAMRSVPFSPSLTRLPSDSLSSRREPAPVRSWSPACSAMPGATGEVRPERSTQAGICTPSTTAAGWASACAEAMSAAASA